MPTPQQQTAVNPIEEQRASALKHYEEASGAIHHWSSFVENAIKAYTPKPESAPQPPQQWKEEHFVHNLFMENADHWSDELNEWTMRQEFFTSIISPLQSKIEELTDANIKLLAENSSLNGELFSTKLTVEELKGEVEAADRQITGMRKDTDMWFEREKNLTAKISSLESENVKLREEILILKDKEENNYLGEFNPSLGE